MRPGKATGARMRKTLLLLPGLAVLLAGCSPALPPFPTISGIPVVSDPDKTAPPAGPPSREPSAAGFDWPDAFEMNRRIGRGVNIGNALEAPAEGDWGVTLQAGYFQAAADAGFASVRLPVRWNSHASPQFPDEIDPAFFRRVDWAVNEALANGLMLILDFHHFTDYMDCAWCQRDRFLRIWGQVAEHYREYPPELVFELLNEPSLAVPAWEWNGAVGAALGVIRSINPHRTVVVGPVGWDSPWTLSTLDLPATDRNLIVTFHYYEPLRFTHQGTDWTAGSDAWLGTTWDGSPAQQQAVRDTFNAVADWARRNGRPILLGEFGAYQKADMASRARWTAFVAREAEARSFAWAYWEFCAGFGVYDPQAYAWRDPLLRALLPNSPLV